jgi:hypothetical protein
MLKLVSSGVYGSARELVALSLDVRGPKGTNGHDHGCKVYLLEMSRSNRLYHHVGPRIDPIRGLKSAVVVTPAI